MRDEIRSNLEAWEADSAGYQREHAPQLNRWHRLGWGVWDVAEDDVHALGDVSGLRALELGCGGGQFGLRVAMRGARVTGLDFSACQLDAARAHRRETGIGMPLVRSDAEQLPFAGGVFDLVFADHGAPSFTDPRIVIPEAARVLKPGGRLVFNLSTPILRLCQPLHDGPPSRAFERPYFDPGHDGPGGAGATECTLLTYGEWIRLFVSSGFAIDDLVELRPPADRAQAATTYGDYAPWEWARDFPAEHIWKAHKKG